MRSGFAGALDFAKADTPGSIPRAAPPPNIADIFRKSLLVDIVFAPLIDRSQFELYARTRREVFGWDNKSLAYTINYSLIQSIESGVNGVPMTCLPFGDYQSGSRNDASSCAVACATTRFASSSALVALVNSM